MYEFLNFSIIIALFRENRGSKIVQSENTIFLKEIIFFILD